MKQKVMSVGARIREAREKAELTQQQIATHLGLSRAAVAQWETDVTSPSIAKIYEVARLFQNTTAEYLAFGVTDEPQIVYKEPEGSVTVEEVVFGDKPSDRSVSSEWSLPKTYLKGDLHVTDTSGVIVWRVESDSMSPTYEYGDRLIIDTNAKRPSPPGIFLIWDGYGPCLANISIVQLGQGKPIARVVTGKTENYEVSADQLNILGRVKGRLHAS